MRKKLERGAYGTGKSTKRMRDSQPFGYVYCEWVTPDAINGGVKSLILAQDER